MAVDDRRASKSDFKISCFIDFTIAGTSVGFFRHWARTFVLTSASNILHCCTSPTLYTLRIARELKIRLLILSSVQESSLARNVSLRIRIRVDTDGHCSPSLTTVLEWCFGRQRILRPISH